MMIQGRLAIVGLAVLIGAPSHAEYSVTDIVDATKRGDTHAVHRLIEENPDSVNSRDDHGFTALHWAGIRGHWRIFTELVEAGAPVDAVGGDGGTPLHWTCHHDRADMVALLLDAGADIDDANRWGRSPLHVTARRGCDSVAALLLERGADPSSKTTEGWTPLHTAFMSGHPEAAAILIARGANEDATNNDGRTPAGVARARPEQVAIEGSLVDDYVGIYDLGGGFSAKVWRDDGGLRIREFAPDSLYPIGEDIFFCQAEPWRVEFTRAENNEIDGIVLHFLRRSVKGEKTPSPMYVGAAACMGCHNDGERGNPAVSWMRSRHGHAYWRLGADWALFLAKLRPHNADLEHPISDERCLLCHVTGRQDDDAILAESFRAEEGVSCESCHGPGSLYIEPEIMSDREAFLANGGLIPDENTCRSCHRNGDQFDWAESWPKIAHGSDALEADDEGQ